MSRQNIFTGTVPGDGTGDTADAAFGKVNANFTELYGFNPVKINVTGSDPTVSSDSGSGYAAGSKWFNSSTGVLWTCRSAAPGAAVWLYTGPSDIIGYAPNQWFLGRRGTLSTSGTLTLNTARFTPITIRERITIAQLGVRITTAGAAGAAIDLALYNSTALGTVQKPGTFIANTGSIVATSTGSVSGSLNGASGQQVEPGKYWLGYNSNDTSIVCACFANANVDMAMTEGSATQATGLISTSVQAHTTPLTFGTWSDLTAVTPTELSGSANVAIQLQVKSVP